MIPPPRSTNARYTLLRGHICNRRCLALDAVGKQRGKRHWPRDRQLACVLSVAEENPVHHRYERTIRFAPIVSIRLYGTIEIYAAVRVLGEGIWLTRTQFRRSAPVTTY
jgi:hypothetical protein